MYMRSGKWCYEHRRIVVAAWVAVLVVVGIISSAAGSDFGGDPEAPESESATGFDLLNEYFGGLGAGFSGSIVFQAAQGIDDPTVRAAIDELSAFAVAEMNPGDITIISPYDANAVGQIATEGDQAGKIAFVRVEISEGVRFNDSAALGEKLAEEAARFEASVEGLRIEIGGESLAGFEPPESEAIGLAFAVVILIVSFGSVLAMGLPVAVALAGVALGSMVTSLLSHVLLMPDFATFMGIMIGLGVGIDYALFIVTRYREGLHRGWDPETSTMAAMDTAGRAVVFAGLTVVASLLGLLLIGLEFIAGLGVGAATTVTITMLASITLLPALLGFAQLRVEINRWRGIIAAGFFAVALLGMGLGLGALAGPALGLALLTIVLGFFVPKLKQVVPRREPKPIEESGWYKWSHLIQANPWPFAIGGTLVLLLLTAPVFSLRLNFSDEGNFPEESTTRQAYDLLSDGFGPGFNGPFFAVTELDGPEDFQAFARVAKAVQDDPGVAAVIGVPVEFTGGQLFPIPNNVEAITAAIDAGGNPLELIGDADAALFQIVPDSAPQDIETEQLIRRLRQDVIPTATAGSGLTVAITGLAPVNIDFSEFLAGRSLVFFGAVLLISFLLLMAVFRSLLVPVKAVIMNMLSISGAYGVIVMIFQWGWFSDITQVSPGPIEPFIPMMMFAIVFGLSMDYEVFLLSRIREEYERTGEARDSVANGLASTARVISAAAAIMVVVFGAFLLEDGRLIKVFGTGLSVAVLLDATLVRMLLVPATMELLGERNWWLPKWLDRLLPELNVEGAPNHDELVAVALAQNNAGARTDEDLVSV